MKLLDYLFTKAKLILVFLYTFIFFTLIAFLVGVMFADNVTSLKIFTFGIFVGCMGGILFTYFIYQSRLSDKFYAYYYVVEEKVNNANSPEELNKILDNEIKVLRKLSQGGYHTHKIIYLFGIIRGKSEGFNA